MRVFGCVLAVVVAAEHQHDHIRLMHPKCDQQQISCLRSLTPALTMRLSEFARSRLVKTLVLLGIVATRRVADDAMGAFACLRLDVAQARLLCPLDVAVP